MQTLKNKTIAIMIALFLTISMSASIMFEPTVTAHTHLHGKSPHMRTSTPHPTLRALANKR